MKFTSAIIAALAVAQLCLSADAKCNGLNCGIKRRLQDNMAMETEGPGAAPTEVPTTAPVVGVTPEPTTPPIDDGETAEPTTPPVEGGEETSSDVPSDIMSAPPSDTGMTSDVPSMVPAPTVPTPPTAPTPVLPVPAGTPTVLPATSGSSSVLSYVVSIAAAITPLFL